ncbi:MAG: phosphoglycerate kinase [Waddliaceae bacterium]
MTSILSIKDLPLKDKRVLIRVDFNVPIDSHGKITDDSRIVASVPTIKYALQQGASCILMSHLGRPKGEIDPKLSLAPCAKHLSMLLGTPVQMAPACRGAKVKKMAQDLLPGSVLLLENLRFEPGEKNPDKDPGFAKEIASYGDVYVNDAFGTSHRAHMSVTTLPTYFPDHSAAGFLLKKEIDFLRDALENPQRPFYALLGGAKVSSKLGVIEALLDKVDALYIGGAMAYTFLKAQGFQIGSSLCEEELIPKAKELLKSKTKIHLPEDHIITNDLENPRQIETVTTEDGIPNGFIGVDIGPKTRTNFGWNIRRAATILWNGPLGVFEKKPFSEGTFAIARSLSNLDAVKIVGGGDSVAAIRKSGLAQHFSHLSTGGGAAVEFLEKRTLPGIEALTKRERK